MSSPEVVPSFLLDPTNGMQIKPVVDPDAHPRLRRYRVSHNVLGPDFDVEVCLALGTLTSPKIDVVAVMPPEPAHNDCPEAYQPFKMESVLQGQNPDPKQELTIAGVAAASLWALYGAPRGEAYHHQPGSL